jgi:hypothetical protein
VAIVGVIMARYILDQAHKPGPRLKAVPLMQMAIKERRNEEEKTR